MKAHRQLLVTTALLYANGPLHLGHLLEQIQADIWVRFQRLQGNDCTFVGGEDAHGTPIMLSAAAQNIDPEHLLDRVFKEHKRDLDGFHIAFDHFGTTHCAENEALVTTIYEKLKANGHITTRWVDQAYDAKRKLFLPDRYVKGTCPHCDTPEQYGDNCEQCGATYHALELKDPRSVLSDTSPITKSAEQYFLVLNHYYEYLKAWIQSDTIPKQTLHKLLDWFNDATGLSDLAISREAPYFGFRIPNTKDKYFYVWIDAPVGYMAIFQQLCQRRSELNFTQYWDAESTAELYHVIGKDIVKFHALFWPSMLKGSNFRSPTRLFVHGYLTIEGRKMSKSRGTFIKASDYLQNLNPEYLRYYLASKLNGTPEDINLNWSDFIQKVNSDCIGKFINIASRCAKLLASHCDNQLSNQLDDPVLFDRFVQAETTIKEHFEQQQFSQAVRLIMSLADEVNQYLAAKAPWKLAKEQSMLSDMQQVCTMALNLFKMLAIYLQPILPVTAKKIADFLSLTKLSWEDWKTPLLNHKIQPYQPLLERITMSDIEAMTTVS